MKVIRVNEVNFLRKYFHIIYFTFDSLLFYKESSRNLPDLDELSRRVQEMKARALLDRQQPNRPEQQSPTTRNDAVLVRTRTPWSSPGPSRTAVSSPGHSRTPVSSPGHNRASVSFPGPSRISVSSPGPSGSSGPRSNVTSPSSSRVPQKRENNENLPSGNVKRKLTNSSKRVNGFKLNLGNLNAFRNEFDVSL